jgi:serine phosphatase RsbU (regulator of sigma subunit)
VTASDRSLLAQAPLFRSLPEAELDRLVETLRPLALPAGAVLFQEGEPGDHFYVILEGEVEVVKSMGDQGERTIGSRGPGEFIGELALVNPDRHRTASVRCIQPTRLRQVSLEEFELLIQRWPPLAYEMVRVLGTRLTEAQSATIRDLREKNSLLVQAYAELQAAQAQIIAREKLERELQLAADIQRSILPRRMPRLKGYGFGARMVPARAVGGDFYDLIPLGRDRMGILIGDVTDKGVPSAIYMAQVHALIYAESWQGVSPGSLLQRVNELMLKINPSSLFATVLYGVLDRSSGVFSYARAGHERPLLCCREGTPEVLPARPGQPLGLFERPVLDEGDWLLPSGSSLFLYTDGVTDDRNPAGEPFGLRNLSQAIAGLPRISAQAACNRLLEVLKQRRGEAEQDDDITLLCIRRAEN